MKTEIRAGNIVKLKNDPESDLMMVDGVFGDGYVQCSWYNQDFIEYDSDRRIAYYPAAELVIYGPK